MVKIKSCIQWENHVIHRYLWIQFYGVGAKKKEESFIKNIENI